MAKIRNTYNSGLVGNGSYIAHVDTTGNVSWMCWPAFDSSFIFGSLLDTEKGGEFSVRPASENYESKQYYLPNTNIICTEFHSDEGSFRVLDFAPRFLQYGRYFKPVLLARKIEHLSGLPRIRVCCHPVGDYGKTKGHPEVRSNHIHFAGLEKAVRLNTNIPLHCVLKEEAFVLDGDRHMLLSWDAPFEKPLENSVEDFLTRTKQYWEKWVLSSHIGSFHQEKVIRSALCLKLHQYHDTGAIIASSTTSLPESHNSGRNWDYRFCWLRDAFYTLQALNNIGHFDELARYSNFLLNVAAKEKGRYQPLYSITGDKELTETSLELNGFLGNQPVRIGNQAHTHIQNDVYGQMMVSLMPLFVDERFAGGGRLPYHPSLIRSILKNIEETMDEPDAGLWEFRNLAQMHAYTFLFHWAGAAAARKSALKHDDQETADWAEQLMSKSAEKIEQCFDPDRGVYTQAVGVKHLDASLLQLVTMRYIDPKSEKSLKHIEGLEKELKSHDGLFYRYKHADDFGKPESTFLICAFWHVEALAASGRLDEAVESFEKLCGYSNHLGLLSEDVDPEANSQWGNFPQTYSHVGLMNAAFEISKALDRPSFL